MLCVSLLLSAFGVSGPWELSDQGWCLLADGLRSRVRGQGSRVGGQHAAIKNKLHGERAAFTACHFQHEEGGSKQRVQTYFEH